MKQILQNLRSGATEIAEVPAPGAGAGRVLIRTRASLISAGSERMLVEFSKGGLIAKAKSQPEKVRQVLDKIKTDGLMPTLQAVFSKLGEPMPLGYCNAGEVLETGPGVTQFQAGDRVASNGSHAEIVSIPENLCAKVPNDVGDEQAAFTVLSSIGLQGIRLLKPTLGERFAVYGLGLIGLISVQLLQAHGCNVMGIDVNPERLILAERLGAETVNASQITDVTSVTDAWTGGRGVDGVLITAAASTDEIIHNSAQMCRKRGRIVLVGVVGLNLNRSDFYEKELTFQVSCSYGPGRYDEKYEQGGQDYPYGFVRWTEQRNFQGVLEAMRNGSLRVDDLITHRFPLQQAAKAYEAMESDRSALGIILQYPTEPAKAPAVTVRGAPAEPSAKPVVGVIGAGNFAKMIMVPSLSRTDARISAIADLNGSAARHLATKYGAEKAVTDYKQIIDDPQVDAVLIAVGHNLHARFVCETLSAGKHCFVEKPLAMNEQELQDVRRAVGDNPDKHLMVGFNRRFSPHIQKAKHLLENRKGPLCMDMVVNAGHIPPEHWVHDPVRGGGRIIGEGCHFIDLLSHLSDSRVTTVSARMVGGNLAVRQDKMSIVLSFEDGSVGTVNYFANGSKKYPKEKLIVFSDGRVLELNNFRVLRSYGFKGFGKFKTSRQDKGHRAEFAAFVERISSGGEPLICFEELDNVTVASMAAVESASTGRTIDL